jgi:hypothetical protein
MSPRLTQEIKVKLIHEMSFPELKFGTLSNGDHNLVALSSYYARQYFIFIGNLNFVTYSLNNTTFPAIIYKLLLYHLKERPE